MVLLSVILLEEKDDRTFGKMFCEGLQKYRKDDINSTKLSKYFNKRINICVLVDQIHEIKTKKSEKMAFVTTSDEYGKVDVVMFPKIYTTNYNINRGDIINVYGKVEKRIDYYQIIANKIEKL